MTSLRTVCRACVLLVFATSIRGEAFADDSWAVKIWLKADDLQRTGLKPGDPVREWKDAAWGVRFSPKPEAPAADRSPTYQEIEIPGSSKRASVVRFDGQASLRQLDVLDPLDERLSAYVVYRTAHGEPTWKQVFAKRDGAFCGYAGGIATPFNSRLIYTVYRETGVRLGALDTLPIAIAGHQGDDNADQRFQGDIAEVIVFARALTPGDGKQELVENYLRQKYSDAPENNDPPPQAPWAVPNAISSPVSDSAETEELPRSSSAKVDGHEIGLDQVSVFSLTNQHDPSNTEFAAGDVTLPFGYAATPSKENRPPCLDFAGQHNPDCCHVFVRIDGELWMFRIDWIADKGKPSRWVGPDIDHMKRVEDGTYPPEIGLGWFLGGMWYDEAERKLYAPVHIEQEGSHRFHPAGGWFSRKIGLCTSLDKGRTWTYEGDIITPETYFYTRDVYKFSGSNNGSGVADFGFYADIRGGYFYIFPEESWYKKGEWGALWGVRAARSKISDKMAPGTWNYFYNGRWEEPALGGKSTTIAPSHLWGVIYSEYLDKYVCIMNSNRDPWIGHGDDIEGILIGCCSDLAKQDWVWGHCPEADFGFLKLFNGDGTDVVSTGRTFQFFSYFADNSYQRLDITLNKEPRTVNNWMPRYAFEPAPESSDPILSRKTRIVGSSSPAMEYSGNWVETTNADSYDEILKEASEPGSSVKFEFTGSDIYWRATRSPKSGKADVYIDGELRKTVDCYSPRSTTQEVFVYLKSGLDPDKPHTIEVVVKGEGHPGATGTAIGHIAFEYAAESYKASAGFCSIMGKNNWRYLQRENSTVAPMQFIPRDDAFVKDWFGGGDSRIGNNYQIPGASVEAVRQWTAPRDGVVRIEGCITADAVDVVSSRLEHNGKVLWEPTDGGDKQAAAHDLTAKVQQGDAIDFVVAAKAGARGDKVSWDPVITYAERGPGTWKPNPPGEENLALGKYASSKVLAFGYQPFKTVDGDDNTLFAIYEDDRLSKGDDWLQVDLDKKCLIDRYVVVSKPANAAWRPQAFAVQRSEDGFNWTEVDSVESNQSERLERTVEPFAARYVRLHFPDGKPFSISEFELYNSGSTSSDLAGE